MASHSHEPVILLGVLAVGLWLSTTMPSALIAAPSNPAPSVGKQPATQTVTLSQFQRTLHRYLTDRWKGKVSKITVHVLAPLEAISVPAGPLGLTVELIGLVMQPGRALFWVSLSVNGRVVQKQKVAAEILAYATVALTTRAIQQGEVLTETDVQLSQWRIRAIEHGLVVAPEVAIGKRIQLGIAEGRPIPLAALERPEVSPVGEETTSGEDSEAAAEGSVSREAPTRPPVPDTGGRFRIR